MNDNRLSGPNFSARLPGMCGRIKTPDEINDIRIAMNITIDRTNAYSPRYNVAPTTPVPVVTSTNHERALEMMRWGLVPSWAGDMKSGYATFNARADSVASKPAFRSAWRAGRRCLVLADGFYEWRKTDKQPFFITLGNRQPMALAGLWDIWKPTAGDAVHSCTVITTDANALIRDIHDRMPVILGPEDWAAWLGEDPASDPASLLKSFPPERMMLWPVNKRVGNVKNDDASLIVRVSEA